jgi:aspartyl-tRNA(Asn)/glutamyl-tRNA(Gln) amidotransferase subunit B
MTRGGGRVGPMSEYIPTIGLEIHAELRTKTKMFCDSKNDPDELRPNTNVCPVCLAHPGTLPVVNREAVKHVLKVGVAINAQLADYTEFDRKNYFYPDLPKGYQISQYEYPLVSKGVLSGVEITRIHLEEDTASSVHDEVKGMTMIDYNRAGVPLMELVTEPVIHSAEQAGAFARELQILLRYLGVSEANMEKGEMRVEANISVSKDAQLGTKTEIKNLNSFKAMEKAVAYEIQRQTEILERGEKVIQQTLGWDENKQQTFPQRIKEGSADYRYFPDPDIPSFRLGELEELKPAVLKASMPELPWQRRERYTALSLKGEDSELFIRDTLLGSFFDEVIRDLKDIKRIALSANYITNDLVNIIRTDSQSSKGKRDTDKPETEIRTEIPISAQNFNKIMDMMARGKISSRSAKDLLAACIFEKKDPETIATERDLFQKNDVGQIQAVIDEIISKNAAVIADYKAGKQAALEFLVGQGMKALKGATNPQVLREMIQKKIG